MQDRFEFLILGGGLAGLAVAAALAPHRRLCLVEREAWLCRHASGRAAAMFIPTYGGPVVSRLARASRGLLAPDLLEPRAALHLASEETDLAAVQQWGRGRRIDAAEIAKLAPGLRAGATALGFLETDAGLIDLAGLVDRLRRAVLRHGPIVTGFEAETIERRQGCWRLRSAERTLAGAVLVNAAGPWADETARLAGVQPLGLQSYRRTLIEAAPPPAVEVRTWPILKQANGQGYLRPAGDAVWASACEETPSPPCDAQSDPLSVALACESLNDLTGRTEWTPTAHWAGLRSFAADRDPVAGWATDAADYFWIAGLGGSGVQSAPALGQAAAAMLGGAPWPEALVAEDLTAALLSPQRLRRVPIGDQ